MVQASLTISGSDFNSDLIERIKFLLNGNLKNFEFQIRIKAKVPNEETRRLIDEAIENIERGENLIEFSPEEYETLVQKLSQK